MKFLIVVAALLLPLPAPAVYRCEQHGQPVYTDLPCDGRKLEVEPSPAPPRDKEDSLRQERSEVGRLQKLREQRERQDQQIRDLAARGAAARERKCRSLALQLKWREEDLRIATMDKAEKARVRLRRSAEKFDAECR